MISSSKFWSSLTWKNWNDIRLTFSIIDDDDNVLDDDGAAAADDDDV